MTGQVVANWRDEEIPLLILRYGYPLVEKEQFTAFYSDVLAPAHRDRGGFPSQIVHNDIVSQLQRIWGERLTALEGDWQRWATELVHLPAHELLAAMNAGPPATLSHCFSPVPSPAERAAHVVHEESVISLMFVKQMEPKFRALSKNVENLGRYFAAVQQEVASLQQLLETHRQIATAYRNTVRRNPARAVSASVEAGVSDASDDDHRPSSDDENSDVNGAGVNESDLEE